MLNLLYFLGHQNLSYLCFVHLGRFSVATLELLMIYDIYFRLGTYSVVKAPEYKALRNLFPVKRLKNHRILAQTCGKPVVMGPVLATLR